MDGKHNVIGKTFGMFMDMDNLLGTDIEKGLARLETVARASGSQEQPLPRFRPTPIGPPPEWLRRLPPPHPSRARRSNCFCTMRLMPHH